MDEINENEEGKERSQQFPENLKYKFAMSEEKVKKEWEEALEKDFDEKIQRIKKGPGEKYGWVFPESSIKTFNKYFTDLEDEITAKYIDNPFVETLMCDIDTGEQYYVNQDRAVEELYPLVYEIRKSGILKLPKPEIPNTFLNEIIKNENSSLGLVPFPQTSEKSNNQKIESIPYVKVDKLKPGAVRYTFLVKMFEESKEFRTLQERQKEKIISFILGVGHRTVKGFKNGESKYINKDHEVEAKELLEKIKKGDFI